jgi:hypothetical protein
MSEFMKRLSEAAGSSAGFVNGEMKDIPAGRTLGKIDAEIIEGKALPTDAREVTAFLAELGKRLDASGLKLVKGKELFVSMMDGGSWLIYLDLKAKNGLAADLRAYGDRKDGKSIYFEVETIGPDASDGLPSNDPLKLHLKNLDLLDAFEEAASVAKGHAEDVLAFRKLDPDFGKGR